MIYDVHTHHYPATPGEAIVQLTPDAFYPQPGHLYSVGLHPWDIRDGWRTQMAKLLVMTLHTHVLMIGETGLDKKNSPASMETQLEVFREHIRLSELIRKPLIVHCVKAFDELLAIRKETRATLPWIIHGFRGGIEQWQQLSRVGLSVSIGEHYDEELVKELPLSQLFIESDERGDLVAIYNLVSETKHIEASELAQHVAANIYSLLTACRPQWTFFTQMV
jgi:TatD DNase family protein